MGILFRNCLCFFTSMFILKISHIFPNTFKYFSGINFQFENFESANQFYGEIDLLHLKKNIYLLSISFLYFSGITHEQTIKVQIGIIKALMISTLPNIERFCFDHDKNKLFIFSIFFPIKFFTFYIIMIMINT
jgi:hypothetical protein